MAAADEEDMWKSQSMTTSLIMEERSDWDPMAESLNQGVAGDEEANETNTGSSPFYQDGRDGHYFGGVAQAAGEQGCDMYETLFSAAAQGMKSLQTFVSRVDHALSPAMAEPDLARMAAGGMESLGDVGNRWFFDARDPETNDTRGNDGDRDPMNPINLLPKMSKIVVLPNMNKMEACFRCNGDAADDASIIASEIGTLVVEETPTLPTLLTSQAASLPSLVKEKLPPQEDPFLMNHSQIFSRNQSQTRGRSLSKSRSQSKTQGRGNSRTRSKSRDKGRSPGRRKSVDRKLARERSKSRTKKIQTSGNPIGKAKVDINTHVISSNSREERKAKPVKQKVEKTSNSSSRNDGKRPPSPASTAASSSKKSQTKDDRGESSKATSGKVGSAFGAVFRRVAPGNKTSKEKKDPASLSNKATRGASAGKSVEQKPPRPAKRWATNVGKKSMGGDVTRNSFKGGVMGQNQKKPESKSKKSRTYEDAEVEDEGSWLADIVGHWQYSKEDQPSMTDLEDQRLGELDDQSSRRAGTNKRLEAAFDPTQDNSYFEPLSAFGLGTLTNSVSFGLGEEDMDREDTAKAAADALDIITGDTDSLWTEGMTTEYGSKGGTADNRAWLEIVTAADILSRYYFDGNQEEESLDEQTYTKVRSALSAFKAHAARLQVSEKALFAAVRDDPSVLESTRTFDDDGGMSGIWSQIGRPLDKYIDSYVVAFEAAFKKKKKGPSQRNIEMRPGSDRVSSRSAANE